MKFSTAALFAVAKAACPTGWTTGTIDSNACVPDGVSISCSDNTMIVTFKLHHVYEEADTHLSTAQKTAAKAHIVGKESTAGCKDFAYVQNDDNIVASYNVNDCSTPNHDTTNTPGIITFTNTFIGDVFALTNADNIVTTNVLSFEAQCKYSDTATVGIDGVTVEPGSVVDETKAGSGSFTFNLGSFTDAGLTTTANAQNKIEIGEKVYNKVWTDDTLPTAIEYHATECTAWETYDSVNKAGSGTSYTIFDSNTCAADSISTNIGVTTGTNSAVVKFSFNSFAFTTAEDTIALVCKVKLCLASETDCYVAAQDSSCSEGYSSN